MMYGLNNSLTESMAKIFLHFPQIKEVVLYGSRAIGTFRPGSDIDLTLKGEGLDLSLLSKVSDELDELLVPYTFDISIYEHISNQDLVNHIARVGVVFYRIKDTRPQ